MISGGSFRVLQLLRRIASRIASRLWSKDRFLGRCNKIIHIGANTGQEREYYDRFGLEVIWIEPIPEVFGALRKNIEAYPKQMALQALLTDRVGETVTFNISNNEGLSSSVLDFSLHKDIWPDVHYVKSLEMKTETLDHLLIEAGCDLGGIDALVIDTQGSELQVLRGAGEVLQKLQYIKVEAADFESYKDCATVNSLTEFLTKRSYVLRKKVPFAMHPTGGLYYDVLFYKKPAFGKSK